MTLDSSGNLGIGTTSPAFGSGSGIEIERSGANATLRLQRVTSSTSTAEFRADASSVYLETRESVPLIFGINATEAARIDSSGNLLVGKTATSNITDGVEFRGDVSTTSATFIGDGVSGTVIINRQGSDGTLLTFRQANTNEGTISVSGTTVSYNGGHLARFAQTVSAKDESLKKGTVLSNLDEMNSYTDEDGNPVENEQLNKVKVSDVEGDSNVAGVFVNWSFDEQHNVDEINMAMTGDMIIRIAAGTSVARGDLLMSAGDGTAKPQGDDIVRAKTIAKVTSTNVTCTYEDGSFCVPCVLMAC
jgi:hypothetical protein